jgi:hypothetical protein
MKGYRWLDRRYKAGYNAIFFSCEDMMKLSSTSMDRKLTLRQRVTRKIHLFLCTWCRRYEQQLKFLRCNIQHFKEEFPEQGETSLSPEAHNRILKEIRKS